MLWLDKWREKYKKWREKLQKMAGKIQKMAGKTDSLFCEALVKSGSSIFRSVVWFGTTLPQLLPTHTADKDRAHFKIFNKFSAYYCTYLLTFVPNR
jgi:hypothetical protein